MDAELLTTQLAADEMWAHEASLLDPDTGYAPGGVHWRWTDGYGNPLRLDPATMQYVDDAIGESADGILLESVEAYETRWVGTMNQLAIQGAYEVALPVAVHVARHDPARVLRQVAAHRALLALARELEALDQWDTAARIREALASIYREDDHG